MSVLSGPSAESLGCRKQDSGGAVSIYDAVSLPTTTSIRLLEFIPPCISDPTIQSSTPISCRLYTADLTASPDYIALSYVWGSEPATEAIIINERTFFVRKNLWDFLNRAKDADTSHRGPLWIDAICINQEDLHERGHQVAIMGKIYRNTRLVISWLGIDDEDYIQGLGYAVELDRWRSAALECGEMPPQEADMKMDKLDKILHHEYWTRTWIIQEVVLPREAVIWVGSRSLSVSILGRFAFPWRLPNNPGSSPASRVMHRRTLEHQYFYGREFWPLSDLYTLLRTIRDSQCKDVRDRIYAILALLDHEQRGWLDIVPDYTITSLQLYKVLEDKFRNISPASDSWLIRSIEVFLILLHQMLDIDPAEYRSVSQEAQGRVDRDLVLDNKGKLT